MTQVTTSRLNQRVKMEQKLRMAPQGPARLPGKKRSVVAVLREVPSLCFSHLLLLIYLFFSRPPKKNFVEVTELTDITYMSNLVKLRPGHMNIVLVLTDASKNVLLSKFAKEVYSFTG